ncbi:hypothetical protein D3C71_1311430 [compost metagenome]
MPDAVPDAVPDTVPDAVPVAVLDPVPNAEPAPRPCSNVCNSLPSNRCDGPGVPKARSTVGTTSTLSTMSFKACPRVALAAADGSITMNGTRCTVS